ncbi:MAG: LutB/LldF family L-lactate oxidation iron-sulfur protein [Salaquimonas sp.]
MQITSPIFKKNTTDAMNDVQLQRALGHVKNNFIQKRQLAVDALPEFDALRESGVAIKNHVLENLDIYLETFEKNVTNSGGHVHWAATAADARGQVLDICRRVGAKSVTKGKSMISEEIGLNEFLESSNIPPIETDLGEYIIQLRGENPSHIIAPAVHLNMDQVREEFLKHHTHLDPDRELSEPESLLREARGILRDKFQKADVGITGANFLIAETGTTIIVTNEGNGDLTQTLPKVHIVIASIEKIVPTLEDMSQIVRILARSATGQDMSVYTTLSTGPRRPDDVDGPEEFHVILLDNGRSNMIGTEFQDMLRCIRCGACMNHCPVYHAVGGHAYGWVYPGPMGSVLTPQFIGVDQAGHLPNASTFCGRCEAVCPMKIPLPKMMRHWREQEFEKHLSAPSHRRNLKLWAWTAKRPAWYRLATRLAARGLWVLGGFKHRTGFLPLASAWTKHRDMPTPQGSTFIAQWKSGKRPSKPPTKAGAL